MRKIRSSQHWELQRSQSAIKEAIDPPAISGSERVTRWPPGRGVIRPASGSLTVEAAAARVAPAMLFLVQM